MREVAEIIYRWMVEAGEIQEKKEGNSKNELTKILSKPNTN